MFERELLRCGRSPGTVAQYRCSLLQLWHFLPEDKHLSRESLLDWKQEITLHKAIRTVNCMIAAVNAFLEFTGAGHLKLKSLKCQRKIFSEDELTQEEFRSLVDQARREGDEQTAVLLTARSGTGVRVSEVRFLTVEAARSRMAVIHLKGKTRQIPLGDKMCTELLAFARKRGIGSGPIFLSKRGKPLDRRRIWKRMKDLCAGAGVDPSKVHPHALRHLFARLFYTPSLYHKNRSIGSEKNFLLLRHENRTDRIKPSIFWWMVLLLHLFPEIKALPVGFLVARSFSRASLQDKILILSCGEVFFIALN